MRSSSWKSRTAAAGLAGLLLSVCALAASPGLVRIDTRQFKGTVVLFKHDLHLQRAGGECKACHPPLVKKIGDPANTADAAHPVCKACHRPRSPSGARAGCLDCHTGAQQDKPAGSAEQRP